MMVGNCILENKFIYNVGSDINCPDRSGEVKL